MKVLMFVAMLIVVLSCASQEVKEREVEYVHQGEALGGK